MCARCPLSSLSAENFLVDLICLPLGGLDVILGMDWLVDNHVHIHCFHERSVSFASCQKKRSLVLLSADQLHKVMREDGGQLFALMASYVC